MKSFSEWKSQGQAIYSEAVKEYHAIESQIAQLEARLEEKKAQVNQIAELTGQPPVVNSLRFPAQVVENDIPSTRKIGSSPRALAGRGIWTR